MESTQKICWLHSGLEAFPAMLKAICSAALSIRFETYIFADDEIGQQFRDALVCACAHGVKVRVLLDGAGSFLLPANYWKELEDAGGEVRYFNPLRLSRFEFRNHRKLLICDDDIAFVGGFNIAKEYHGDGVASGWRDLGLQLHRQLSVELVDSFEEMFATAGMGRKKLKSHRYATQNQTLVEHPCKLLLSGPGCGKNMFKRHLKLDRSHARDVKIIAAYFLPTWQLRRELTRVVRRGGKVQLILAGKSDVFLSQMACRSLYLRLLKSGLEIYEYRPQILHAKLILIDEKVYVDSSNLDTRSLHINHEMMLRFQDSKLAAEGRQVFAGDLAQSTRVDPELWRKSQTWWKSLRQRLAYFILARIDPFLAQCQYNGVWNQLRNVK